MTKDGYVSRGQARVISFNHETIVNLRLEDLNPCGGGAMESTTLLFVVYRCIARFQTMPKHLFPQLPFSSVWLV